MKDSIGIYYNPYPQNKKVRAYVRESGGMILFRLWNRDDPQLWEEHGWVPLGAIKQAMSPYEEKGLNLKKVYDLEVAKMLIKTDG